MRKIPFIKPMIAAVVATTLISGVALGEMNLTNNNLTAAEVTPSPDVTGVPLASESATPVVTAVPTDTPSPSATPVLAADAATPTPTPEVVDSTPRPTPTPPAVYTYDARGNQISVVTHN